MCIFKKFAVGVLLLFGLGGSLFGETIVDNSKNLLMYSEYQSTSNKYSRGRYFVYQKFVESVLDDKKRYYINRAINLETEVASMKEDWATYAKYLSTVQGVLLSKPKVLDEKSKNSFKGLAKESAKKVAKGLIKMTVNLTAGEFTKDNEALQTELTNNFSPILELVLVDLTTATTHKEKMAAALSVFNSTMANTAINIGGALKAMSYKTYYESYIHIISFLDEYYKCNSDIANLINKNNLELNYFQEQLKYTNYDLYITSVFNAYTVKQYPDYPGTRGGIIGIMLQTLKDIDSITKIAIDTEREYQRNLRIERYVSKYFLSDKIQYLEDNKIYPRFIELDSTSIYAINKNVKLKDFLFALSQVNRWAVNPYLLNSVSNISDYDTYISIDLAVKIMDEYTKISFENIKPVLGQFYDLYAIKQNKEKYMSTINKIFFKKYSKEIIVEDYVKRQFVQIQGRSIATNENELSSITSKGLNGYKAIRMLYNLTITLKKYEGQ